MKFILNFSLVALLAGCTTNSQPAKQKEATTERLPAVKPSIENPENGVVGFACYEGGSQTEIVAIYEKLILQKENDAIRQKLFSPLPADQYLATLVCEKLSQKSALAFTEQELKQIMAFRQSPKQVATCSGCTEAETPSLAALLSAENTFTNVEAANWLKGLGL